MGLNSTVFPDKNGTALQAGDLIIYGHALGRCAGIQYGKVLGVLPGKEDAPSKLKVRGVDSNDNMDHERPDYAKTERAMEQKRLQTNPEETWVIWSPKLLKTSTLQYPSRVLKIFRDQVPAEILGMLDSIIL